MHNHQTAVPKSWYLTFQAPCSAHSLGSVHICRYIATIVVLAILDQNMYPILTDTCSAMNQRIIAVQSSRTVIVESALKIGTPKWLMSDRCF